MSKRKAMYVFRGSPPRGDRGWIAQVPGKPARFFADARFGREDAFNKARKYAKRLTNRTRVNPETGRYLHKKPSSGVFRFVHLNKRGKPAVWIAVACIEPGKVKRRQFYVRTHGEKEAERLARQAHAEMVKLILGNQTS